MLTTRWEVIEDDNNNAKKMIHIENNDELPDIEESAISLLGGTTYSIMTNSSLIDLGQRIICYTNSIRIRRQCYGSQWVRKPDTKQDKQTETQRRKHTK